MKDPHTSPHRDLLTDIENLMDAHREARPVLPVETGKVLLAEGLVEEITSLLQRATGLLGVISERFPVDELEAEMGEPAPRIAGLTFVVRAQLGEAQTDLDRAVRGEDIWRLATVVDSSWHHMLNGLRAIETALRAAAGLAPRPHPPIYLEESLDVRRLYSRFRRSVLAAGEPEEAEEVEARLRAAAATITGLRELTIYPFLRIGDRLELRALRKRIVGWLDGDQEPQAGQRIWQDLASFVRLLLQINLREELIEHDRRTVAEIHDMLPPEPRAAAEVPTTVRHKLTTLLGRDEELDELLLRPEPINLAELTRPLARLQAQLASRRRHVTLEILQD